MSALLSWGGGHAVGGLALLTHPRDGVFAVSFPPESRCSGPGWRVGCQKGAGLALPGSDPASPTAIFCDYYNPPDECEWHYEPCGNRSFETCRTVNGIHSNISVSYLEGERAPGAEAQGPLQTRRVAWERPRGAGDLRSGADQAHLAVKPRPRPGGEAEGSRTGGCLTQGSRGTSSGPWS